MEEVYRLKIQLTKRSDGGAVLKCVRNDGTRTWQKQEGKNAALFAQWAELTPGATLELRF